MAAMKNEVNGPLMLTIGAISAILLVTSAVAVDGWYKNVEADEIVSKWDSSPNTWLHDLHEKEQQNLDDSHRIPRAPRYRVTISDAMRIVVKNGGKLTD